MRLLSKKMWKWQNRNGCPRKRDCASKRYKRKRERDCQTKFNAKRPKKDKKIFLLSFPDGKIYFLLIHFFHLPPSSHLANQKDFIAVTLFFQFSKTTHYLAIDHHSLQIVSKTLSLLMCWNCQIDFKVCLYKILSALMIM